MMVEIPDKHYFKIGEVSKLAGVVPHVLRYWETEFKDIKPRRASSNQRMYKRDDVELILQIKQLLHDQGYTISGARQYLESGRSHLPPGKAPDQNHTDIDSRLTIIKQELIQLRALLRNKK